MKHPYLPVLIFFAVAFLKPPIGGFLVAMLFLLLLAEGLLWAWSKGLLNLARSRETRTHGLRRVISAPRGGPLNRRSAGDASSWSPA